MVKYEAIERTIRAETFAERHMRVQSIRVPVDGGGTAVRRVVLSDKYCLVAARMTNVSTLSAARTGRDGGEDGVVFGHLVNQ